MSHSCTVVGLGFLLKFDEFKKILYNIYFKQINTKYEDFNKIFDKDYFQYKFSFNDFDEDEIDFYERIKKKYCINNIELIYRFPIDDEIFFILHKLYNVNSESKINIVKKIIPDNMNFIKKKESENAIRFLKENGLENITIDWYIMNYNR